MKTVLIINSTVRQCGVYNFGKRFYELASNIETANIVYREVNSLQQLIIFKTQLRPDIIIYNWHRGTMGWLTEDAIRKDRNSQHWFIFHEEFIRTSYDKYLFFGAYDMKNRVPREKSVLLPRPLMEYKGEYPSNKILTIGTFGFPFWQKGLHTLVEWVNKNIDKATLNFLTPKNGFVDASGAQSDAVLAECKRLNTNPNIQLNIYKDFRDEQDVLRFLAGNDINVFMYTENGEGISSVIDFALSVKRPIAITPCNMFRHIFSAEIILKDDLRKILNNGTRPLQKYYEMWKPENFIKELEQTINA